VKHEFISYHSVAVENEFAMTVGFCRDPADDDSLDGLILERGRGEEDDTPGIKGVYVEIPIQRHVVYGGITGATLGRDSFKLQFDAAAAREMGGFGEILVHFQVADDEFIAIRDGLRYVFKDCSCYHESNS